MDEDNYIPLKTLTLPSASLVVVTFVDPEFSIHILMQYTFNIRNTTHCKCHQIKKERPNPNIANFWEHSK